MTTEVAHFTSMLFRRVRALCLLSALMLSSGVAPARAAVHADFDADGILDAATLDAGGRAGIHVSLSATGRSVLLSLRERPLWLVALDVNHDGRIDLAGISQQRGLVLFKNDNGGRFTRLRVHLRPRRLSTADLLAPLERLHRRPEPTGGEATLDTLRYDDHGDAEGVGDFVRPGALVASHVTRQHTPFPQQASLRPGTSRAPPA